MKAHFKVNHRLSWAFKVCEKLGIDDPCAWMDAVDPVVVDRWIAYKLYEGESKSGSTENTPEEALKVLKGL